VKKKKGQIQRRKSKDLENHQGIPGRRGGKGKGTRPSLGVLQSVDHELERGSRGRKFRGEKRVQEP